MNPTTKRNMLSELEQFHIPKNSDTIFGGSIMEITEKSKSLELVTWC